MKLAPIGIAAKLVSIATADMTEMQEINFTPNPIAVNSVKSLYGYKFKNDSKETLLIINTSDSDFSTVQFDNLVTYSGQPKLTQYHSETPYVTPVYEGHSNIVSSITNVTNNFKVNKFSIAVIEIDKETLSVETESLNDVAIFPNQTKDIITLSTNNIIQSVTIWNALGGQVYFEENIKSNKIDVSNFNDGIYLVKITSGKGAVFKKIIKI